MPRYFFDVHDGEFFPDTVGTELPKPDDARIHAVRYAGQLLTAGESRFWQGQEWVIDVRDHAGALLFTLAFVARGGEGGSPGGRLA